MESFFNQVFTLLTTPPGNLVYWAILAFSIFGALQMSARYWGDIQNKLARRMALGLVGLLILQLLLFIAGGLGWQSLLDAHKILPVIVWGASLLSILWLIWLWAFPDISPSADAATALLSLLIIAMTVLGVIWWSGQSPLLFFNGSLAEQTAGLMGMGLCLIGGLLLLFRRPALWGLGLASMIILFLGCGVNWLYPAPESDYAGTIRLAEMIIYPLLLALPQRSLGGEDEADEPVRGVSQKDSGRRIETDPKLLQVYLSLATETNPKEFYQAVAKAYAQMMVADMCLLVLPPDDRNEIVIMVGYDLIKDKVIDGFSINARNLPLLLNVLRRGRNLRLPARSTSIDLASLANALEVKQAGHLLAVAVSPKGGSPLLGIILLSPYSNRIWSAEDQQSLIDTSLPLAGIIQRTKHDAQQQQALDKAQSNADAAQTQALKAQQEMDAAVTQVDALQAQLSQERIRAAGLADQVAELESSLSNLRNEASRTSSSEEADHLQAELDLALAEIMRLKAEFSLANISTQHTRGAESDQNKAEERIGLVSAIVRELHRPIETIHEQVNQLLEETVNTSAAGQRKSLERVKTAAERVSGLLDEMIAITAADHSVKTLHLTAVDLNGVIDEVMSVLINRLGERNIALRVDLPELLPKLYADRQAVSLILSSLMRNAEMVTPDDGEVWLRARVEEKENAPAYLLLQVTDSGVGIAPDVIGRVFSPTKSEDSHTDQKGVILDGSLAQIKYLVEAHDGRIWVDSEIGKGATFSVLLPLLIDTLDLDLGGGLGI